MAGEGMSLMLWILAVGREPRDRVQVIDWSFLLAARARPRPRLIGSCQVGAPFWGALAGAGGAWRPLVRRGAEGPRTALFPASPKWCRGPGQRPGGFTQ
jgi:hypothetical protein